MMQNTDWQTTPDFHYRHLIYETKKSNCGDMFHEQGKEEFQGYYIFTMLRHPVDRLVSEYYFLRQHPEFMALLSKEPRDFDEFITLPETANYMLKFLNGDRIYDPNLMSEARAIEIIDSMECLDVYVGIYEHFDLSLAYFEQTGAIRWPDKVAIKRATINRPPVQALDKQTIANILENNALDLKLYQHFNDKLLTKAAEIDRKKYRHIGDRFDHILPYTMRFCILEIALKNKAFIESNKKFLITLNIYLHKTVRNGKEYAKKWVKLFKQHIQHFYSDTAFAQQIKKVKRANAIEDIKAIAEIIDQHIARPINSVNLLTPRLKFMMTPAMEAVFAQEGLVNTRSPIW